MTVGDASPHGLTPGSATARRRRPLGRTNYRRRSANYGCLPARGG